MNEKFTSIQKIAPGRICRDPGFPPVRGAPQPQNTGQHAGFGGWLHIKETRHRQCFTLHMRDGPPMACIARGSVFAEVKGRSVYRKGAETRREKEERSVYRRDAETRREKGEEVFIAETRRRRERREKKCLPQRRRDAEREGRRSVYRRDAETRREKGEEVFIAETQRENLAP